MTTLPWTPGLAVLAFGTMSTIQLLLLLGVVLSVLWAILSSFRKMNHAGRMPQPSLRELHAVSEKTRSAARDLEELMAELDQMAHQLHGRLDARLEKMEMLIKQADDRLDRLDRWQRADRNEPVVDVTLDGEPPVDAESGMDAPEALHQRHAAIFELADGGLSPVEIADEVNKPAGEIELILALRKARSRASGQVSIS